MGNQFNNWKRIARSSGSGYEQTQATGTDAQSTCVAHLRWRPALPLQHYIEILLLRNIQKNKKTLYVREPDSHRAQPLVRSSRSHRRLLARKISKNRKRFFDFSR